MCFLRGPLRWLTEQKNPKFLWSLENAQRDTTNLAISRDFFWVFKTNVSIFRVLSFMLPGNIYLWLGNSAWDFSGTNFGPAIFWGFVWSPRDFLEFWLLPPFDHPCTWNPEYSLWPWVKLKRTLNFSHFPSRVNLHSLIGNCVEESNEKTKPS